MKKIINTIKKRKLLYITIFTLIILAISSKYIISTFSLQEPVKSITITSNNVSYQNNEAGSWKTTKSAKWTDVGKARITFDVDTIAKTRDNVYRDVIMVLDISGSMNGDKLNRVKSDSIELINSILSESNNKVALITFESSSTLVSNLTNDKDTLINHINNLSDEGCTNYYEAFKNVEEILNNYNKLSDRECIVLFLTDGYPNTETPNEVGEYNYLKDTYPFITVNGVQYEMGDYVLDPIKKVSDNQFIADMNILNNVLFNAALVSESYEDFTITDYIDTDYFNIDSIDNINTSVGKSTLKDNKLNWNINNFRSGNKATMTIDISLKDEYLNSGGTFPTNTKTDIKSVIIDNTETVTTTNTPILTDKYVVMYDDNAPSNCNVSNVPDNETRNVFSTVKLSDQKPICDGYVFKGWKVVTENVDIINDDYFVMPESDIRVRAVWSKLSINKNVDGKVAEVQNIYSIMKDQAVLDNIASEKVESTTGIDFSEISSDFNGEGVYEKSGTENNEYPIYYFRGNVTNNNVVFGGFCWKMVRTTDTGGVKIIYNGIPNDGKCNSTGDSTLIGKSAINNDNTSLSSAGYMYGSTYDYTYKNMSEWYNFYGKSRETKNILQGRNGSNYYFADYAVWDGNKYVLDNSNNLNDIDSEEVKIYNWSSNYNELIGKYTCASKNETTCNSVYYISGGNSSYMYYISLSDGKNIDNYGLVSKNVSYTKGEGYSLVDPINIVKVNNEARWYTNYSNYKNYYFCTGDNGLSSTKCDSLYYIDGSSLTNAYVVPLTNGETYDNITSKKMIFGNSVDSSGNLLDTISLNYDEWNNSGNQKIVNSHYTCFNTSGICNENVYYIYNAPSTTLYYITLPIGKTIEQAITDMLDNNTVSSTIKGNATTENTIDYWYYNNIENKKDNKGNSYSTYIEDTVYCNDRSILNYEGSGWDPNGGSIRNTINFSSFGKTDSPSITCSREIDRFTVSPSNGNGALTYPIGLLTTDEVWLAGGTTRDNNFKYYLWNGTPGTSSTYSATEWWTATPSGFTNVSAYHYAVFPNGHISNRYVHANFGIRPVISIKKGTRIISGDGTRENPYIL